jgi:hypothetical protein
MSLASLYFLEVILGNWFLGCFVRHTAYPCPNTHLQDGLRFIQFYPVHAVKCALIRLSAWNFTQVCVVLCDVHNRGPLWAFPHFSSYASDKDLSVTECLIYLLHYRSCFWVLIRVRTTFRFQRCFLSCPVFPEFQCWDVRQLGVHCSSHSFVRGCWNGGRATELIGTTVAKVELAAKALHKVKSVQHTVRSNH